MKALVTTAAHTAVTMERELPDYQGKVLIRVKYAGICGSDLGIFKGAHPRAKFPLICGHEFVGTVEALGEGVSNEFKPGDRVVVNPIYYCGKCRACLSGNYQVCNNLRLIGIDCDGGMAEFSAVPEKNVMKLPDALPFEQAVLIEPVAVIMRAMRQLAAPFYSFAVVTGGGPMGLLMAIALRTSGVSRLVIVEVNEDRLRRAKALGFETVNPKETDAVQYILDATGGEGAGVLVEASGSAVVAKDITHMTAPRGKILMLSVFKHPAEIDLRDVNFKEQEIIGTRVYNDLDFKDAIDFTCQYADVLKHVASHFIPIDEGAHAFDVALDSATDAMKVVIRCRED